MNNFFQAQKRYYTNTIQYNFFMYQHYQEVHKPETQVIELANKTSNIVKRKKAKRKYKKKISLRWR